MPARSVTSDSNFHSELKSATDFQHRDLEALSVSRSLADGTISNESYIKYLLAMHDFVGSVEKKAFPLLEDFLPDVQLRGKTLWLAHDLDRSADESQFIFDDSTWNAAFAFGVAYVVEGSTLGGRYIMAKLLESGHIPHDKMRFFDGYGHRTGMMWKNFLNSLSAFADSDERQTEVTAGANFAFLAIKEHLRLRTA